MEFDAPAVGRPIGVFDSGIGGLSIVNALRTELPHEEFVYVSDRGFAPYGERDTQHVLTRSREIAQYLLTRHHIKTLVIACNTATAASISVLRQEQPGLPIIGVEPALKPAVFQSLTRRIGVMATRGTLASAKFHALTASLKGQADFVFQPCDHLADAIEREDNAKVAALCADYTRTMGEFGVKEGQIDTLVLGCTHYPFASAPLLELLGPSVHLVGNGEPVARQTRRMLPTLASGDAVGQCILFCTGECDTLQRAAQRWLAHDGRVKTIWV